MTFSAFLHALGNPSLRDLPIAYGVVILFHAVYLLRMVRGSRRRTGDR